MLFLSLEFFCDRAGIDFPAIVRKFSSNLSESLQKTADGTPFDAVLTVSA
jgi:hypothetical protein